MVVSIGEVEFLVRNSQPAGLLKRARTAVRLARFAAAEKRFDGARFRIEFLDLVVVGVGDQYLVVEGNYAERMLQSDIISLAVHVAEVKQISTNHCLYSSVCQIDCPNNV